MSVVTPLYASNPINYAISVGLTSIAVIGANSNRKKLMFHNPHGTFKIAVCCQQDSTGANQPAVMNGKGSFVILPLSTLIFDQQPTSGFNAISDNAGGQLSIFEVM
jgi:hypothetical protein